MSLATALLRHAAIFACIAGLAAPAWAQETPAEAPGEPAAEAPADEGPAEPAYEAAELTGLNKITARTHPIKTTVGETVRFGTLGITVQACHKSRPEDPPKTVAFLVIRDYPVNIEGEDAEEAMMEEDPEPIFTGWMLASSPGLNALEHPVYDVWLTDCSTSSGSGSSGSE